MDTHIEAIRDLFYEKILLYRELVENLQAERSFLAKAEIDALWKVSAKKQELVSAIEDARGKVLKILSGMSITHEMTVSTFSLSRVVSHMSGVERRLLRKPHLTLVGLKAQTRQLSAENKAFIEESLEFLDEIMGVIAGAGNSDGVYDDGGSVRANGPGSRLFCREV